MSAMFLKMTLIILWPKYNESFQVRKAGIGVGSWKRFNGEVFSQILEDRFYKEKREEGVTQWGRKKSKQPKDKGMWIYIVSCV